MTTCCMRLVIIKAVRDINFSFYLGKYKFYIFKKYKFYFNFIFQKLIPLQHLT